MKNFELYTHTPIGVPNYNNNMVPLLAPRVKFDNRRGSQDFDEFAVTPGGLIRAGAKIATLGQAFGGSDFDDYDGPDERISCDKNGHAQRSLFNQPNHLKFWRKQK